MTPAADTRTQNDQTYETLISLIENSQGRLAPIIVACDDWALRQRLIDQYEMEARQAKIRPYRVKLGQEPSVRAALVRLKEEHDHLQRGGEAVFTITGAEVLLRVTLKPEDEQSELDKFFGYLQWTREGLREFPYPIVLWVTHRILKEISRRAPDFWSWRKAVLRFTPETEAALSATALLSPLPSSIAPPSNDFLPPLDELQAEIQQLEASATESPNLATLYDQLGQVYAHRVESGKATDLVQERDTAIAAFQTAIQQYQQLARSSAQANALNRLGNFLFSQSQFIDAIDVHRQSLVIQHGLGNRNGEATSLGNLGNVYTSLGQYPQAIDSYQQSIAIQREIGDFDGEGGNLCNLGNVYQSLGQYSRAIEVYQQALEVQRRVGNREFEVNSLTGLGSAYYFSKQYPQAIDCYQQSLAIAREIGDRRGEANSLNNLGNVYHSLRQYSQEIDFLQQSLVIYREIGDRRGEADSLNNFGNVYNALKQYQRAIAFLEQSLVIYREIGDRRGEANSLGNLGNAYNSLEQYQQAIQYFQKQYEIAHQIMARHGEANSLFNMGNALARLDQHYEALQSYQQALALYKALGIDHWVEQCKKVIAERNKIIAMQRRTAPSIATQSPVKIIGGKRACPHLPKGLQPVRRVHLWRGGSSGG
jgi:tetratricopeptide (TPR) repeat protein